MKNIFFVYLHLNDCKFSYKVVVTEILQEHIFYQHYPPNNHNYNNLLYL